MIKLYSKINCGLGPEIRDITPNGRNMLTIQSQTHEGKILKCTIFVGVRRSDIF